MDTNAYIQSGALEAYALGTLSAAEAAEVEALVAAQPALRLELDAIEAGLQAYAEAQRKMPAHDLEGRIWNAIEGTQLDSAPSEENTPHRTATAARVLPMPAVERRATRAGLARAAGIALLIASLALNAYLWNERRLARERIARLEARREQQATFFASRISAQDRQLRAYAMMKELMADPTVRTVRLQNLRPGADRASIVFHNVESGAAFLAVQKMPPPPPGKQYQLWVMQGGKPHGIGLLEGGVGSEGAADIQLIPVSVTGAEAFAISIENAGGALTPTMSEIVMMGKV